MNKNYIKINIASPKKILKWTERSLPNRELIGKITKPIRLKINKKLSYSNNKYINVILL